LAFAYEKGLGVNQNEAEALRLSRLGANAGDARSMSSIGDFYADGRGGVAIDPVEAVAWYRRAAALGDSFAQVSLGTHYRYGVGVPLDRTEAARWYRLAAEQGNRL